MSVWNGSRGVGGLLLLLGCLQCDPGGGRDAGAPDGDADHGEDAGIDVTLDGEADGDVEGHDAADGSGDPEEDAPPCDGLEWQLDSLAELLDQPGQHYRYAPAALIDEAGGLHLWMCGNPEAGAVRDHILYSEPGPEGGLTAPAIAFGPGEPGAWDSFHTCDPSVVEGEFLFEGESYRYALFYSGNDVDSTDHVQLGVAFSHEIAGGGSWTRRTTPLIEHPPGDGWGVGQPSALSVDGGGRVLLFYTRAETVPHVYVREVDLTDGGSPLVGEERMLHEEGLTGVDGRPDVFTNVDVALDEALGTLFIVTERHPFPTDEPTGLVHSLQVLRAELEDVIAGVERWVPTLVLAEDITGSSRYHNAGLLRSLGGSLPARPELTVVFSDSCNGCGFPDWLFNVDLQRIDAERTCGP